MKASGNYAPNRLGQWSTLAIRLAVFAIGLELSIALLAVAVHTSGKGPVARYRFDEGSGQTVSDSSGHHHGGRIIGSATWTKGIRGEALLFDGSNRVSIPSSPPFNLTRQVTVTAWVRGTGEKFRIVRLPSSYPSLRGPYFQVCGETIYFAANIDRASSENPALSRDTTLKGHPGFPWNDWQLWTGSLDINLTGYRDTPRTWWPLTGLEPKLQVVGNRAYYEYFGQDPHRVWQIWTAQSNTDGSDWHSAQRTNKKDGYRVEQEGNLQVVGKQIYYGWPEKDAKDRWQLWTATSDLDGSHFRAVQRTTDGGWIPNLQVVKDKIFYMYPTFHYENNRSVAYSCDDTLFFATSDADGSNWKVLRAIPRVCMLPGGWGSFQVSRGRIYLAFNQGVGDRGGYLFTGFMNADGSGFHAVRRTFGDNPAGPVQSGLQVIGDKVDYTFVLLPTTKSVQELYDQAGSLRGLGESGIQLWTAEANLDGSDWKATQRTSGRRDIFGGYRGIDVVGAKAYIGAMDSPHYPEDPVRMYPMMATFGSNIVSKGGAFGMGLTDTGLLRAFINVGDDYRFQAEAPADPAGAIADYPLDKSWHFVAMTFDGATLNLYVDGQLKASTPYQAAIQPNPFPLVVGDGFNGTIDEVSIYDHALTSKGISELYSSVLRPGLVAKRGED